METIYLPDDPEDRDRALAKLAESGPFVLHQLPASRLSRDHGERLRQLFALLREGIIDIRTHDAMRAMDPRDDTDGVFMVLRPAP